MELMFFDNFLSKSPSLFYHLKLGKTKIFLYFVLGGGGGGVNVCDRLACLILLDWINY